MNSGVITINCAFSSSRDSNSTVVKERDSAGVTEVCSRPVGMEDDQNLKETELRLGLPGDDDSRESSSAAKMAASGAKRGFSEAMASRKPGNGGFSGGKWAFPVLTQVGGAAGTIMAASEAEACKANQNGKFLQQALTSPKQQGLAASSSSSWQAGGLDHSLPAPSYLSPRPNLNGKCVVNDAGPKDSGHPKMLQERPRLPSEMQHASGKSQTPPAADPAMAPASKAQVVGWPPIRSFRKNTLAANPLYVKVSMDGAPYLRKVDLKMYSRYQELSSALEEMFSCFTIGQCGSHSIPGRDGLSESNLMDLLHGSEYVLTYEDKDGDWMLVGDVPWQMFVDSCKKLHITKASEAIGLAPRAMEKCKNRS